MPKELKLGKIILKIFISDMKKSSAKHEITVATGTETYIHPATPDGPDSMALALKGTIFHQFYLVKQYF